MNFSSQRGSSLSSWWVLIENGELITKLNLSGRENESKIHVICKYL